MELIFEKSRPGRVCCAPTPCETPDAFGSLAPRARRQTPPRLPEVAEVDFTRHYMALSRRAYGVDNGFYPLGSCTMKYNPKHMEDAASLSGFTDIHPLQPAHTAQGCLALMHSLAGWLCELAGMDAFSLTPAAGAHGEWAGLLMIKKYLRAKGEGARDTVLVPESAHGTNPASATMAGFKVVTVPDGADGGVDVEALRKLAGPGTAALMLTNPNTLGLFEKNIETIADIIHGAGGLLYYDGANLNAIMGVTRPGDMAFDVVHLNLHKTCGTPHGGGGPGSGPVGCKAFLAPYLPLPNLTLEDGMYALAPRPESVGTVKCFYGNFLVMVKAYAYIATLGGDGLREASEAAVLNANYLMSKLSGLFGGEADVARRSAPPAGRIREANVLTRRCMHEFVVSCEELKKETGVAALDVAKAMLDYGIHPPTMYFPLIVPEALMFEPTETESVETLDACAHALRKIVETARQNPEALHGVSPERTPVSRPDEAKAARNPVLAWRPDTRN